MSPKSKVLSPRSKTEDRRLKTKIFIILLFVTFFIFACTNPKPNRDGIVIADSDKYEASIFRQNCAICHGKEGNGKILQDGKKVPPLRFGDAKKKTREEIYQQIVNGKLPMPSYKDSLSEREIQNMVDFIIYDLQARDIKEVK